MEFQVGDEIRFVYTGQKGRITKDNLNGSYMVYNYDLEDEIIGWNDTIILAKDFKHVEKAHLRDKHQKYKKLSTEEAFYDRKAIDRDAYEGKKKPSTMDIYFGEDAKYIEPEEQTELIEKPIAEIPLLQKIQENKPFEAAPIKLVKGSKAGLFLAFYKYAPKAYSIYLVNDTDYSISFYYERYVNDYQEHELKHTIAPNDAFPIDEFLEEDFNENVILDFEAKALKFKDAIKIKYKTFLKKYVSKTPLISAPTYLYPLFAGDYNPLNQSNNIQDLATYTKEKLANIAPKLKQKNQLSISEQRALFNTSIDLHIEKLIENTAEIKGKVIDFQLGKMSSYLEKAAKLGINKVTIIHGIGEGKLKDAVQKRLKTHPLVKTFDMGATLGSTQVELK